MSADEGKLIAVIGDEDTVIGFLLAGIGHRTVEGQNFLVVKPGTEVAIIEDFFKKITNRPDIGIVLINQTIAHEIRGLINDYTKTIPTILEIPSKEIPYDSSKDSTMRRVCMVLGIQH